MSADKRIVEAIPPRRQWDPRVVSGVKRVNSGEDPGRVALDLAMVVPGFSRTQLGAYTAAYNRDAANRAAKRRKVEAGASRAAFPKTMAKAKQIVRDLGYSPKFIDATTKGYRVKLGYVAPERIAARVEELQQELNNAGYHDIVAKSIGMAPDIGFVVPFVQDELYESKAIQEGLFGGEEPDVADRDNKEQAVQALLGSEDVDVKKVPDEKLSGLIQGLGSITTESIDSQVSQIVSVMREQHASRNDVLEALRVHVGFNLREAKEVLQEYLREGAKQHAETLTPGERSHYKPGSKKNVDQMTESSSPVRPRERYGVFSRGGSVGSKHSGPVATFDNVEDAKQYAARLRKTLTPGERSYYKMGYVVRALKEATENIHQELPRYS